MVVILFVASSNWHLSSSLSFTSSSPLGSRMRVLFLRFPTAVLAWRFAACGVAALLESCVSAGRIVLLSFLYFAVIKNWILKIVDTRRSLLLSCKSLSSPPLSLPHLFSLPFLPALWIILEHECRAGHKASGEADKENLVSRLNFLADQGAKSQRNSYVQHAIS